MQAADSICHSTPATSFDEDFETAMVFMEEFDWWLSELALPSRTLPLDVGDELRKLTDELMEKLQPAAEAEPRERSRQTRSERVETEPGGRTRT